MKIDKDCELLEMIVTQTKPTGSMEFGLPNPTDCDRYCDRKTYDSLIAELNKAGVTHLPGGSCANESRSTLFDLCGQHFNVFVVADDQIDTWDCVTQMMKVAAARFPQAAGVKPLRIAMFRNIRDTLAMWKQLDKMKGGAE